jgi:hypothetical protein
VELITGQVEYVSDVLSVANARENISNFLIPETARAALKGDVSTPLFNGPLAYLCFRTGDIALHDRAPTA